MGQIYGLTLKTQDGREHLDGDDTLMWAEGLKEGADVQPLPFGMVLDNGVVPVVAVDIDDESWLHC
jgi:hypothetical protein